MTIRLYAQTIQFLQLIYYSCLLCTRKPVIRVRTINDNIFFIVGFTDGDMYTVTLKMTDN